jgi:fructan beta-fructosidase
MRVIVFCVLFVVVLGVGLLFSSLVHEEYDYRQEHRPQFHFSPPVNWMNDPNGLVYLDGEYHLFYQYNPFGNEWGHMSWGHAVSPDLVRWEHLPVALPEEDGVMVFSGSAAVDFSNTSGFGTPDTPPLVAIYTGHTERLQTQNIAFSIDRGRSWKTYDGNPVLDTGKKDFRDPKVFRHAPTGRWIMAVALPVERKISFYGSEDLIRWDHLSDFGPAGAVDGIWECPDLFELPVEGSASRKWVLIVSLNPGSIAGGSGMQYFVGDFDGTRFTAKASEGPKWVDYGRDFYAAVSWSDIPEADGRRIWLGWMSNWDYAGSVPTSPWRGAMSIPRALKLKEKGTGFDLVQTPLEELKVLRTEVMNLDNLGLARAGRRLGELRGDTLEIQAEIRVGSARDLGLAVRIGNGQNTRAGYDSGQSVVYVDRTESGKADLHPAFPGRHSAPLSPRQGIVKLHVFVDRSSVELFANDGERVITDLIFPDGSSLGLGLYEEGGTAEVISLKVWKLDSIW